MSPPPALGYRVQARAFDQAGNPDTSPWPISNFTVTVPPPTPGDTTTWSYTFTQTGGSGSYRIQTRATDTATPTANVQTSFPTRQYTQL